MDNPTPRPVERYAIDALTPHPRNVREGDVGAIVTSLAAFGQYRPIVVQRVRGKAHLGVILAGTHTWMAARQAGMETIDAVALDVDDETAVRIMLTDNRTHDLGHDNDDQLAALLAELAREERLPPGWDTDDVDELLRTVGTLGGERTSFLAGYGTPAADGGLAPVASDIPDGVDPGLFVTVSFTMTRDDRERIMAAVKRVQDRANATQPEALLTIVAEWEARV